MHMPSIMHHHPAMGENQVFHEKYWLIRKRSLCTESSRAMTHKGGICLHTQVQYTWASPGRTLCSSPATQWSVFMLLESVHHSCMWIWKLLRHSSLHSVLISSIHRPAIPKCVSKAQTLLQVPASFYQQSSLFPTMNSGGPIEIFSPDPSRLMGGEGLHLNFFTIPHSFPS